MSSSQEESNASTGTLEEPVKTLIENKPTENLQSDTIKLQTSEENQQENKEKEEETSEEEDLLMSRIKSKRKRKFKEDLALHNLTEDFLNVYYPISSCLSKNISIGISISDNCTPKVTLRQGTKKVKFSEKAWESFNKYLRLIECYLTNRVNGKKTNVVLDNSDIEVENIKMRGDQHVKFRDVTKHEEKITLSPDEFEMLVTVVPAVNRYMKQLTLSLPMIKDYLNETLESNSPLLYGPVDVSIYNRLPQEVFVFRRMKAKRAKIETEEEEQYEEQAKCLSNCSYSQEPNFTFSEEGTDEVDSHPLTQAN